MLAPAKVAAWRVLSKDLVQLWQQNEQRKKLMIFSNFLDNELNVLNCVV